MWRLCQCKRHFTRSIVIFLKILKKRYNQLWSIISDRVLGWWLKKYLCPKMLNLLTSRTKACFLVVSVHSVVTNINFYLYCLWSEVREYCGGSGAEQWAQNSLFFFCVFNLCKLHQPCRWSMKFYFLYICTVQYQQLHSQTNFTHSGASDTLAVGSQRW